MTGPRTGATEAGTGAGTGGPPSPSTESQETAIPTVDNAKQIENLKAAGVVPGGATASSLAVSESGSLEIGGEGAKHYGEPGVGAEEVGEDSGVNPGKAHGAQLEPALMTPSGSLPHAHIPSPSGPVPAGVIADRGTREEALRRTIKQHTDGRGRVRNSRFRLSDAEIERSSPAALRAIGSDRGYDMPDGGRRAIQSAFRNAQKDDDSLVDPEKGVEATRVLDQQPIPVPGALTPPAATTATRPAPTGEATRGSTRR